MISDCAFTDHAAVKGCKMPELPEVETLRRGLAPALEGATIAAVEQRRANLRFAFPDGFAERLTGARITALTRRAKYLLAELDSGEVLVMHLGMSGSFRIAAGDEKVGDKNAAHDHVVLHLKGGTPANCAVIYNDPRRFGFMTLIDRREIDGHKLFAGLGIEPTGNALDPAALAGKFAGRAAPLKAVLMDQKIIAGLGNIYVCEALWRAKLSPRRAAGTLVRSNGMAGERLDRLTQAVRAVIADAIAAGGSSLRDYTRTDGSLGYFQHVFAVYDRAGDACLRPGCGGTIARIVQSGRSSFYCPKCQR